VSDQIAKRHLRVVNIARAARHERVSFLIGEEGISVLAITSLALNTQMSTERIATGIPRWMRCWAGRDFFAAAASCLGHGGHRQRSSPQLCGRPPAARRAGAFLSFEDAAQPDQCANMHSIGLRLERCPKGPAAFHSARPSLCGLECIWPQCSGDRSV